MTLKPNPFVQTPEYAERVYAGVLGKIIGVYAGRPFEGWTHERILEQLGEIDRYVADELNVPLVVTDDDISGTFTFLRALSDYGDSPNLTPEQIGDTWLNYIIEGRTILWWGGIGMSTEHTAYLRLKNGIPAPKSGSIQLNGKTVAEQIGSQIFIDGWGLIHPGEPELAAEFAKRAASVSHDGEAIYGAQMVAAMVSLAFSESSIHDVVRKASLVIPTSSVIATVIRDIEQWHAGGLTWREAYQNLKATHGYATYPSNCHIIPNHGVVILALLYGEGDFSRSLMLANTCGWDTDCNSANVGCIVGVLGGLATIDSGYDWRDPVSDRLFLPTADGGRCISDAVIEAQEVIRMAHAIRDLVYEPPKAGARFNFAFPGSVQGFSSNGALLSNDGSGLHLFLRESVAWAMTPTFANISELRMPGYQMVCSPTLASGQTVRAQVKAAGTPVTCQIVCHALTVNDLPLVLYGEPATITDNQSQILEFQVPDTSGYPVTDIGIQVRGNACSQVILDWLHWDGSPNLTLRKTEQGSAWQSAWVNGVDDFQPWSNPIGVVQNEGTGLLGYGCREWTDLAVESELKLFLIGSAGIAVRVQGLKRYYALVVTKDHRVQLIKARGKVTVLAEVPFYFELDDAVRFRLAVDENRLIGSLNETEVLQASDLVDPLTGGGIGIVVTEGRVGFEQVKVSPIKG